MSYMSMQVRMALDLGNVSRRLVTLMQECPRGVNLSDMLSTDYNMTCLLYDDKCDQLADELRWMAHH